MIKEVKISLNKIF